jgi:hypothetical protein
VYRYCPQCRAEYVAAAAQCSDCLVPLVDELPPEEPEASDPPWDPENELVEVYAVGQIDAQVVRSLLEGNGIPAVVASEGAGGMYPVNVGFGAGRVLVRRRDVATARELIYEAERGDFALREGELPDE